tara:strand:- start:1094 stop:1279 length:186 start_codon:yes stop_codon:yes gene_type:complete
MHGKGIIMDRFIEIEISKIKNAYQWIEERKLHEDKLLCQKAKKIADKLGMEFNHFWNAYIV